MEKALQTRPWNEIVGGSRAVSNRDLRYPHGTLQHTATHYTALQHTTTHCNSDTLQHTATHSRYPHGSHTCPNRCFGALFNSSMKKALQTTPWHKIVGASRAVSNRDLWYPHGSHTCPNRCLGALLTSSMKRVLSKKHT